MAAGKVKALSLQAHDVAEALRGLSQPAAPAGEGDGGAASQPAAATLAAAHARAAALLLAGRSAEAAAALDERGAWTHELMGLAVGFAARAGAPAPPPALVPSDWRAAVLGFAARLEAGREPHLAAAYRLAARDVRGAVAGYERAGLLRDALALAGARLLPEDPGLLRLRRAAAAAAAAEGQLEAAAAGLLLVGAPAEAAAALAGRGTVPAFLAASRLLRPLPGAAAGADAAAAAAAAAVDVPHGRAYCLRAVSVAASDAERLAAMECAREWGEPTAAAAAMLLSFVSLVAPPPPQQAPPTAPPLTGPAARTSTSAAARPPAKRELPPAAQQPSSGGRAYSRQALLALRPGPRAEPGQRLLALRRDAPPGLLLPPSADGGGGPAAARGPPPPSADGAAAAPSASSRGGGWAVHAARRR